MNGWDKRILELLNCSELDPTFRKFLDDLRLLKSAINFEADPVPQYYFSEIGVSLLLMNKRICSATFFSRDYVNDMPFGLPQKAMRDDVHKILGTPSEVNNRVPLPWTDRKKSESYVLEEFRVTCWYSLPDEELESLIVRRHDFLQSEVNNET